MKYFESLDGSPTGGVSRDFTVRHGSTTVENGALLVRGATPGTNGGMVIVAGAALTDVVGILLEELLSTATDSTILGTTENRRKVLPCPPNSVIIADYSQGTGDDVAVTSSSGTTITVGSLEDDIDGGWVLTVNSTAASSNLSLRYLTASAAGSATMKSAFTTDLTSADSIVKVLPRLHQLLVITTDATQLGTTAAAGTARATVVDNYLKADGIPLHVLDPVNDSPRNVMTGVTIYSALTLLNSAFQPLD